MHVIQQHWTLAYTGKEFTLRLKIALRQNAHQILEFGFQFEFQIAHGVLLADSAAQGQLRLIRTHEKFNRPAIHITSAPSTQALSDGGRVASVAIDPQCERRVAMGVKPSGGGIIAKIEEDVQHFVYDDSGAPVLLRKPRETSLDQF